MRIVKISTFNNASKDLEEVYENLEKSLDQIDLNNNGKAKKYIKKSIDLLEKIRPHLKYKDMLPRRKI